MARLTGQSWASHAEPVEFVLNGQYMGLYFVVENVKISGKRLDIYEQPDLNDDEETLPWGWLVEVDNNPDDNYISIAETPGKTLNITAHTPEEMSEGQRRWLTDEMTLLNDLIMNSSSDDWAEHIDANSAAQYFMVREAFVDRDGYAGSMYLHRDTVGNELWKFGPLWDIASTHIEKTAWNIPGGFHYGYHWFDGIMEKTAFKLALVEQWGLFYPQRAELMDFIKRLAEICNPSDDADARRWPIFTHSQTPISYADGYVDLLGKNLDWMNSEINEVKTGIETPEVADAPKEIYDLWGRRLSYPVRGINIIGGRKIYVR
ncbi:MAG: CotH kinase family protein [Bacteroides sp.]|nr:CotH kinase family protein [Bacteroides sp.]MCM1445527.1 CotH kinase family protein [Prevotella sp.]